MCEKAPETFTELLKILPDEGKETYIKKLNVMNNLVAPMCRIAQKKYYDIVLSLR